MNALVECSHERVSGISPVRRMRDVQNIQSDK